MEIGYKGMGEYKDYKDFTTLDAWIKCQDVKLFFLRRFYQNCLKRNNSI